MTDTTITTRIMIITMLITASIGGRSPTIKIIGQRNYRPAANGYWPSQFGIGFEVNCSMKPSLQINRPALLWFWIFDRQEVICQQRNASFRESPTFNRSQGPSTKNSVMFPTATTHPSKTCRWAEHFLCSTLAFLVTRTPLVNQLFFQLSNNRFAMLIVERSTIC